MPQTAQLLWFILIIGVIGVGAMLLGILAARLVKKRLRSASPNQAFTIQDLREMRRRGEITDQEYQAMRATTIAQMTTPPSYEQREPTPSDRECEQQQPDTPGDPPAAEDS